MPIFRICEHYTFFITCTMPGFIICKYTIFRICKHYLHFYKLLTLHALYHPNLWMLCRVYLHDLWTLHAPSWFADTAQLAHPSGAKAGPKLVAQWGQYGLPMWAPYGVLPQFASGPHGLLVETMWACPYGPPKPLWASCGLTRWALCVVSMWAQHGLLVGAMWAPHETYQLPT